MAALIKLGGIVTDISGKIGGQSFGNGRGGAYIKNIGSYVNNRSMSRQRSKYNLATISQRWRTLQPVVRDSWNAAASTRPYINKLGETKFLSGFNLFVQYRSNLKALEVPGILLPGPTPSFPDYSFELVTCNPTEITLQAGDIEASNQLLISATPSISNGAVFSRKRIKNVGIITINSPDLRVNVIEEYVKQFGEPISGTTIYLESKIIDADFGASVNANIVIAADVTFL